MSRLTRLAALSREQRALLGRALLLVLAIRIALWVLPSGSIAERVRRLTAGAPRRVEHPADAQAIVWAVEAVSRRVPGATCLTQALAAHLLLLRNGHAAEFCVGVARDTAGEFRAHAWLEQEGRIIIGGIGARAFTRFPDLTQGGFIRAFGAK